MNKLFYMLSLLCFFFLQASIAQTVSVSGKVLRHSGEPVEGATVICTNASPVLSAPDGSFTFAGLPEGASYEINAMFETDVFDGITILDVLFARNMIIVPGFGYSDFQLFAGDINVSGALSTIDLVLMSNAAVKIDGNLPVTYWHFFDGNSSGTGLQGGIILTNVTEDVNNLELVATKKGDVAIDSDHLPPPPGAPNTGYYVPDVSATAGEEIDVEIRVNDFKKIAGFQHDLNWDPNALEFIELVESDFANPRTNEAFLAEGHFPISVGILDDSSANMELEDGSLLYTLKFKALSDILTIAGLVEFSEEIIPSQTVYRDDNNDLFLLEDAYETAVFTSTGGISALELFEILPNPSQNGVFVRLSFENSQELELKLYDLMGQLLQSWTLEGQAFEQYLPLDGLATGTYTLSIRTNEGVVGKRLIKQ